MSKATEDLLFSILSTLLRIEQHLRPQDNVQIRSASAEAITGVDWMKLQGIRTKGVRVNSDGKVVKEDKRPSQARQRHRRTKNKVTGVRAAK